MPLGAAFPRGIPFARGKQRAPVLIGLLAAFAAFAARAQSPTGAPEASPLPAVNYPTQYNSGPPSSSAPPATGRETIWIVENGVSTPYYYAAGGWFYRDADHRPHGASPRVMQAIAARQAAGRTGGGFQAGGGPALTGPAHGLPNAARHPIVPVGHASQAAEPPGRR